MKYPKNRDNIYILTRWTYDDNKTINIASYRHLDDADDAKDAAYQEWIDRGWDVDVHEGRVVFKVEITTFYG